MKNSLLRIHTTVEKFRKFGHVFTMSPVVAVISNDGKVPAGCPADLALTEEQAAWLKRAAATPKYPLILADPSEADLDIVTASREAHAIARQRDEESRQLAEIKEQREVAERTIRELNDARAALERQLAEAQDKQRRAEEAAARAEERIAAAEAKRAELEEQDSQPRKKPRG